MSEDTPRKTGPDLLEPRPLSFLEVLDEEYWALLDKGPSDESFRLRAAYLKAGNSDPACAVETPEALAYRDYVIGKLHESRRRALCFSGGGIRSATFALGILQGLAHHSRKHGLDRPDLLGEFDYLSTVSGGGYLGGWFSAWASRLSKRENLDAPPVSEPGPKPDIPDTKAPGASHPATPEQVTAEQARRAELAKPDIPLKQADIPDRRDGSALVMHDLAQLPKRLFAPERTPLQYLRAYSNYLSPHSGLLSGDTWALASTVVRNMFLNWLVLLPAFAAVLLLPVLCWRILRLQPGDFQWQTIWTLGAVSLIFGAVATAYVGYDLPNAGNAKRPTRSFIMGCLIPLTISAVSLVLFWRWLPPDGTPRGWWDIVGYGASGLQFWHFGIFGALMHGGGMLLGMIHVKLRFNRPATMTSILASLAALVTGFAGGIVAWLIPHFASSSSQLQSAMQIPKIYACVAFPAVMAIFAFSSVLLVGTTSYLTEDEDREWWARSGGWFLALALGWLAFSSVTLFAAATLDEINLRVGTALSALTGISGFLAAKAGKSAASSSGMHETEGYKAGTGISSALLQRFGTKLILPVFLLLLTVLIATFNGRMLLWMGAPLVYDKLWDSAKEPLTLLTTYALICAIASWFINVNKFSLHAMYRARLIRAYLGASNEARDPHPFTGFDENDNVAMCALTAHRPMHVVNMTLNLVHGSNLAWQERKGASYTSTRLHTGGLCVGYRDSDRYGGHYKNLRNKVPITLGTAITISGAAASPNMGYHSSPLLTLVMTLFNARLGWWLGNPNAPNKVWERPGPRWGIRAFFDEAAGLTTSTNPWVYLSDGGHFENLGLYEMVLRRCHHIVISDAGCDPNYAYEDLANAIRKIRIDLGISIEFTPPSMPMSPSQRPDDRYSGRHCALGTIQYSDVDGPDAPFGTIVYIKPSLNGNEPADLQHYATSHKPFPHQPTSDQFFSESQFESYRALGRHIIDEILTSPDGQAKDYTFDGFIEAARWYMNPIFDDNS